MLDHINPDTHKGPKVNGYLIQKQDDGRWHIYDANGDHTLHDRAHMAETCMVAKMNEPSRRTSKLEAA